MKISNKKLLLPITVSTLIPLYAVAQAPQTETMVVMSSRTDLTQENSAQVVSIITQEKIEQQLALTSDSSQVLSNLLPAYSPNTQKLNNSSQTFRGRSVLYMIDGVPQSNPLREGSRSAHTIDLSMVERIEVIHGATAIHGLGATGAIINFITKSNNTSEPLKQHFDLQLTTPTNDADTDSLAYRATYNAKGSKDNWDYLVGVTGDVQGIFEDANGNDVGSATVRGDLMDSRSYDGFVKLGYWFSDSENLQFAVNQYQVKGQMNYTGVPGDRDNGIATSSVKGRPVGKAALNDVQTYSLVYTDTDFSGMSLKAQTFYQRFVGRYGATTSSSFQDPSTPEKIYDQSQNESDKIGAKFSLSKEGLLNQTLNITGGLDLLKDTTSQNLILTGRTYVPETTYYNYAPFLQLEYQPIERLVLQAGVRYENAKLDIPTYQTVAARNGVTVDGGSPSFDKTVYNAGAVFKLTPSVSAFANYSQGFGMPDVGRVLRGVKKTGQDVDDLIDLSPIITDNYEGGFRINKDSLDFEISYYESISKLGSRIVNNGGLYTIKRERKEIKGAEASVGYQFNQQHRFVTGYSYIEGKSDTDGDNQVDTKLTGADIPPNRLRIAWTAQWTPDLFTMLQANHNFDRTFDDEALNFNGYTLVDASMEYTLPVGKLRVSVANLLNEDYFTYYSQSAYQDDDFYFKGRGRTLTIGYGLNF
ncbi:TonB-dependent receptor [Vibrio gazogenes]|uniref:Iron complex outermembrane recepter protein n=1 Tax=Vibrio gazogenes DSM 21264 = NBRC 103151 TaxID=1123492 RepID=A0A1M4UPV6_VIBGA|nr:TonB-dependent receptor [Vibrio gazogenes]USP15712.1 TonB-dependent receptor [Vibrio gazogenes]SHE58792.1 iron complex outermembrane recepter protein [Vibrio gazogenes DSM 21264] [Vibrio gazogenes DSM 21264 = NBRC 103151]SJN57708.1 Ferric aerobactin receptor precursor [Vibrio gazogenes]